VKTGIFNYYSHFNSNLERISFLKVLFKDQDPGQNPESIKMLDPDLGSINPDPKHWYLN
jgi:hypothetical protein